MAELWDRWCCRGQGVRVRHEVNEPRRQRGARHVVVDVWHREGRALGSRAKPNVQGFPDWKENRAPAGGHVCGTNILQGRKPGRRGV